MNATERLADPGFGNYMLNGLREISLPAPPSYRPQTLGWTILAGVALFCLSLWGVQQYRRWQRDRYRRAALQRLTELEPLAQQSSTQAVALKQLAALLKQTALVAYPREQVAQLSGDAWLNFLDRTYAGQGFTQGDGRVLSQLAYQSPAAMAQLSPAQVTGLITTVHDWLETHRPTALASIDSQPAL